MIKRENKERIIKRVKRERNDESKEKENEKNSELSKKSIDEFESVGIKNLKHTPFSNRLAKPKRESLNFEIYDIFKRFKSTFLFSVSL